jgi:hypothetical protein
MLQVPHVNIEIALVSGHAKRAVSGMQFVLGVIMFVVVIGVIDAKLPWPKPRSKDGQA